MPFHDSISDDDSGTESFLPAAGSETPPAARRKMSALRPSGSAVKRQSSVRWGPADVAGTRQPSFRPENDGDEVMWPRNPKGLTVVPPSLAGDGSPAAAATAIRPPVAAKGGAMAASATAPPSRAPSFKRMTSISRTAAVPPASRGASASAARADASAGDTDSEPAGTSTSEAAGADPDSSVEGRPNGKARTGGVLGGFTVRSDLPKLSKQLMEFRYDLRTQRPAPEMQALDVARTRAAQMDRLDASRLGALSPNVRGMVAELEAGAAAIEKLSRWRQSLAEALDRMSAASYARPLQREARPSVFEDSRKKMLRTPAHLRALAAQGDWVRRATLAAILEQANPEGWAAALSGNGRSASPPRPNAAASQEDADAVAMLASLDSAVARIKEEYMREHEREKRMFPQVFAPPSPTDVLPSPAVHAPTPPRPPGRSVFDGLTAKSQMHRARHRRSSGTWDADMVDEEPVKHGFPSFMDPMTRRAVEHAYGQGEKPRLGEAVADPNAKPTIKAAAATAAAMAARAAAAVMRAEQEAEDASAAARTLHAIRAASHGTSKLTAAYAAAGLSADGKTRLPEPVPVPGQPPQRRAVTSEGGSRSQHGAPNSPARPELRRNNSSVKAGGLTAESSYIGAPRLSSPGSSSGALFANNGGQLSAGLSFGAGLIGTGSRSAHASGSHSLPTGGSVSRSASFVKSLPLPSSSRQESITRSHSSLSLLARLRDASAVLPAPPLPPPQQQALYIQDGTQSLGREGTFSGGTYVAADVSVPGYHRNAGLPSRRPSTVAVAEKPTTDGAAPQFFVAGQNRRMSLMGRRPSRAGVRGTLALPAAMTASASTGLLPPRGGRGPLSLLGLDLADAASLAALNSTLMEPSYWAEAAVSHRTSKAQRGTTRAYSRGGGAAPELPPDRARPAGNRGSSRVTAAELRETAKRSLFLELLAGPAPPRRSMWDEPVEQSPRT